MQTMLMRFLSVVLLFLAGSFAGAQQMKLDVLKVGSQVYSNVTLLRASATDLYFMYDGTIKNVKLKYVSPELQKQFEYDPKAAEDAERAMETFTPVVGLPGVATPGTNRPPSSPDSLLDPISERSLLGKPGPKLDGVKWMGTRPAVEGKCVLVCVFTSWSFPSRALIPQLNTLSKQSGDKLVVVGLTTEPETALSSMSEAKVEFPCAQDVQGKWAGAAGITSVPHVLLMDRKGVVHYSGHPAGLTERKLSSLMSVPE